MFEINKHKPIVSDLPIITNNRLNLLADENPILYTGTNRYGNRILGVIVEESEEEFFVRYFHVIIDDEKYYDFVNGKTTLRKIIESADVIFVLDMQGEKVIDNNLVTIDEIPADYLPLEESYCPADAFVPSLNYGVSLKGKKADFHLAEVQETNNIQTSFADVLRNTFSGLEGLELRPKLYLEPAKLGSFRVNYRIEFEDVQSSMFHVDKSLIADYIESFLKYIITKLPQEEKNALKEQHISSVAFKEVEDKLIQIYQKAHLELTKDELEKKLIDNINESALKFEGVTNQIKNSSSFDKIELINYESSGGELGLGIINGEFFDSIKEQLVIPAPEVSTDVIEEDVNPTTYRIRVYKLSNKTGNCYAYFYPDESETNYEIPILINKGNKEYSHSTISKSLDEDKVINIQGRAKKVNGEVKSIKVDL